MSGNIWGQVIGGVLGALGTTSKLYGSRYQRNAAKRRGDIVDAQNALSRRQSVREGFQSVSRLNATTSLTGLDRSSFGRAGISSSGAQTAFNLTYIDYLNRKGADVRKAELQANRFNATGEVLIAAGQAISSASSGYGG